MSWVSHHIQSSSQGRTSGTMYITLSSIRSLATQPQPQQPTNIPNSQNFIPSSIPNPIIEIGADHEHQENGMLIAKIEMLENDRIDRNANSITGIFPNSSQPFQQELLELLSPVF
jgi:hypothetical protein